MKDKTLKRPSTDIDSLSLPRKKQKIETPLQVEEEYPLFQLPLIPLLTLLKYLTIQEIASLTMICHAAIAELNQARNFLLQDRLPKDQKDQLRSDGEKPWAKLDKLKLSSFLNFLRISEEHKPLNNRLTTNFSSLIPAVFTKPQKFVGFLSPEMKATPLAFPDHNFQLALLCNKKSNIPFSKLEKSTSPLHIKYLAFFGYWNLLNKILCHTPSSAWYLALDYAILSGQTLIIDKLFESQQKPKSFSIYQNTVNLAAFSGRPDIFDKIYSHPSEHPITIQQKTLQMAVGSGNLEMFQIIYSHPEKPSYVQINQESLDWAASSNQLEMLDAILLCGGKNVCLNQKVLLSAIKAGALKTAKAVLQHPNFQGEGLNQTALDNAALSGVTSMVKWVQSTANPASLSISQRTLDYAVVSGQPEMFDKIFQSAPKDTIGIQQSTLGYAILSTQPNMVDKILSHPQKPKEVAITQVELNTAARCLEIEMFNKILRYKSTSITQEILDQTARAGGSEMFLHVLQTAKAISPTVGVSQHTLDMAILSGSLETLSIGMTQAKKQFMGSRPIIGVQYQIEYAILSRDLDMLDKILKLRKEVIQPGIFLEVAKIDIASFSLVCFHQEPDERTLQFILEYNGPEIISQAVIEDINKRLEDIKYQRMDAYQIT